MSVRRARRNRVALVHDWLVNQRGGENVLLELARMFPEAPIYTLVCDRNSIHPELAERLIHTSAIQQWPGAPRRFRQYLPWFPQAVEAWDLAAYDTIISTSHCVAKGVITQPRQHHIAYIHTPMRYIWDQMPQYLPEGWLGQQIMPLAERAAASLRAWDVRSAQRPTQLVANSHYVAQRIARVWGREAEVVYPPVDVDFFAAAEVAGPRYGYVVVCALVPYKRVELAIRLANKRHFPLTVVGRGPQLRRLRRLARDTVTFQAHLSPEELRQTYARARGLLFCGVEDCGMAPIEAMAAGCPILALGIGGLRETVLHAGRHPTGTLFQEPTLSSLEAAFDRFEMARQKGVFRADRLAAQARKFDRHVFVRAVRRLVRSSAASLSLAQARPL